jgi:hypothetical protein
LTVHALLCVRITEPSTGRVQVLKEADPGDELPLPALLVTKPSELATHVNLWLVLPSPITVLPLAANVSVPAGDTVSALALDAHAAVTTSASVTPSQLAEMRSAVLIS